MLQDVELELNVLAAVVEHGKDGWIEISDIVKCETFYNQDNQVYFKCIEDALKLSDKLDRPLFLSSAHKLGLDSVVKENKVNVDRLFSGSSSINNIRINGKRLAKLSIGRTGKAKLRTAMSELEELSGEETTNNILSIVEKPGYAIQAILNNTEEDGGLIGRNAVSYVEQLINCPNREVGVSTGFKEYDKAIGGGIRRGGFALIGARRKIGKSSHAVNVALYVANKIKIPVLYLDTEMQCDEHLSRILANMTSIPISSIEHATFANNQLLKSQLIEASKKLSSTMITHERVAGKDFDEVLSIMRRWLVKRVGYHESGKMNNCLIIYDYFKLMDPSSLKNMQEYQAISFQAIKLHDFLGEVDVPCLAYVQLNREKDIAQSDRLSWNATSVCLFMEKEPDEIVNDGYENGNRKIVFDVARFGAGLEKGDYINVDFNGSLCQMTEIGLASQAKEDAAIGKAGYTVRGGKAPKEDFEDDEAPF